MLARALMVATLLITPITTAAQDATTLRDLLIRYRCPVVDRLEQVYTAGDPTNSLHRFLLISLQDREQAYVQCIFHDSNTKVYCEAASGFYEQPDASRKFHQPPDTVAALGRLGFSIDDSAGNFNVEFNVANPPDLTAIADFMLAALHDGYGARAETELVLDAPFAPRATFKCDAVS